MNYLRSLESWNRGLEFPSRHGCLYIRLFCFFVVLCISSGLATGLSLVQGLLPSVKKNDHGTDKEARRPVWAVRPIERKRASRDSSVGIATEFKFRQGQEISLCPTAYRLALGPNQPPIQWVPGCLSLWVKRPAREADPPSSGEIKNGGAVPLLPYTSSWRGAQLIKYRDNFTFSPYLLVLWD
jgi:hypothetical protein